MDQALALWGQFQSAHPVYGSVAAFLAGMLAPRLVTLAEKSGIPWFVARARERQRVLLSKVMTPEQLQALEQREAADLRAAADNLEKPNTP